MPPVESAPAGEPAAEPRAGFRTTTDRIAALLALATVVCVGAVFMLAADTKFLMPGPLSKAHGAIGQCSACHTRTGIGITGWLHGLVPGDRHADSKACLACHKMPDTAMNPHGATPAVLSESTRRLEQYVKNTRAPHAAEAQRLAFPIEAIVDRGLQCATCHSDHRGNDPGLTKLTGAQCQSCHVLKFDGFDGGHPQFENFPFERRTRIIFDHAGHFGKHFPDVAKKEQAVHTPATCSTCHASRTDRRVMTVEPFEKTCSGCHLGQITGKDRATGPKGIAFLSLPGLDVQTLKQRKPDLGEWPEASEARLTPFMKLMIARTARGRALLKAVRNLDLQNLKSASNLQIEAVSSLAWEIKEIFHALIEGNAAEVLAAIEPGADATPTASQLAELTAGIPLDVITTAQIQWLPNLASEISKRRAGGEKRKGSWITMELTTASQKPPRSKASEGKPQPAGNSGQQSPPRVALSPAGNSAAALPAAGPDTNPAKSASGERSRTAGKRPPAKGPDQTDDLLFPTDAELRAIKDRTLPKAAVAAKPAPSGAATTPAAGKTVPGTQAAATPPPTPEQAAKTGAPAIGGDVDPESWAAIGGWYRQDHAIFYRPAGHRDKFFYAWLRLAGPGAPKASTSPMAAVFEDLTGKEAQGACTKCHSVDDVGSSGRTVNFRPVSADSKAGRLTAFVHEPHFAIPGEPGCLSCHKLEKGRRYLESFEQGNPQVHASNFGKITKDTCQACHNSQNARQDCQLCHKYHAITPAPPTMSTKVPVQP